MKVILVTGCCGFIASNFINYVLKERQTYKIIGVDKMDYCSSLKNLTVEYNFETGETSERNLENFTFYKTNINNHEFIMHILEKEKVNFIYHFAAQSHVDNSFLNIESFVNDNILGTTCLIECAKKYGKLEKFIHVSTDEVYGEIIDENHILIEGFYDPCNPYSASKASAELIVKAYARSYNVPTIITRSNNVYGINQFMEKVIPKFIEKIYNGEKCPIYGKGGALRKYLYVDDASIAYLNILENGKIGIVYEMGSTDEYNTLNVLESIIKIMKQDESFDNYIEYVPDRLFHDSRYLVNTTSMNELGWSPKTSFKDGLTKVIKWYTTYAIPFNHWL